MQNEIQIEDGVQLPPAEGSKRKPKKANATVKNAQTKSSEESSAVVSLDLPGVAKQLAKRISEDIDLYCQKTYDGGHRNHLGASLIGRECSRYLWYVFRWCHHHKFDGRKQRLFNRGHREEDRFIEWLEGIGAKVWTHDFQAKPLYYIAEDNSFYWQEDIPAQAQELAVRVTDEAQFKLAQKLGFEFPQYRISDCSGHFGGSLDAIIQLPEWYGIAEPVLGEFKTNGTGAGFNKLGSDGMPVAKPEHYAQTSTYGKKYGFRWCLYFNINKNDDSLHVEVVKLDHNLGERNIAKAERIIMSPTPPERISNNPTTKTCQYCDMKEICHGNRPVEKNCRSCAMCQPIDGAKWFCHTYQQEVPAHVIAVGCDQHRSINLQ